MYSKASKCRSLPSWNGQCRLWQIEHKTISAPRLVWSFGNQDRLEWTPKHTIPIQTPHMSRLHLAFFKLSLWCSLSLSIFIWISLQFLSEGTNSLPSGADKTAIKEAPAASLGGCVSLRWILYVLTYCSMSKRHLQIKKDMDGVTDGNGRFVRSGCSQKAIVWSSPRWIQALNSRDFQRHSRVTMKQ